MTGYDITYNKPAMLYGTTWLRFVAYRANVNCKIPYTGFGLRPCSTAGRIGNDATAAFYWDCDL